MPEDNAPRRCPNCGALASADAEWCGQCFASLLAPRGQPAAASEPEPVQVPDSAVATAAVDPASGTTTKHAVWPCPICEHENPIELSFCEVCGASFSALMRQGEKPPKVDPRDATVRSLIFPGLGYGKLGMGGEGFVRGTLFVIVLGMTALLLASGVHTGPAVTLVSLYAVITLVIYLGTAYEARRIAQGGGPIVSGRLLVWAIGGLILITVMIFALGVTTAARS